MTALMAAEVCMEVEKHTVTPVRPDRPVIIAAAILHRVPETNE